MPTIKMLFKKILLKEISTKILNEFQKFTKVKNTDVNKNQLILGFRSTKFTFSFKSIHNNHGNQ